MTNADVHVRKTSPAALMKDVRHILDESDLSKWDLKSPTYIKMNGNYDRYYPGSNTSPWFMNALLSALCDIGFKHLTVVEGDLPYFTADDMILRTRTMEILKRYNVPFVNYESMERDENEIPKMLLNAQVINVPVPHGHGFAVISCAVKNLFGLLPNPRRRFHRALSDTILHLAEKVKPFTIVDATVGLVGPSTRRGKPVRMDLILAGWDTVALDVVMAKMMGYELEDIPHLKLASQQGQVPQINLIGDYHWKTLPSFYWPLKIDAPRQIANYLEFTSLGSSRTFQTVENWLERMYHHVTFILKKKQLFNGPWMEYDKHLNKQLHKQ